MRPTPSSSEENISGASSNVQGSDSVAENQCVKFGLIYDFCLGKSLKYCGRSSPASSGEGGREGERCNVKCNHTMSLFPLRFSRYYPLYLYLKLILPPLRDV